MNDTAVESGWKHILVKAPCEWARVLTPFTASWTGSRGAYSIALELSQAQLHKLMQLGYKGVAKPSKYPNKFVYNFKRFTATLKGVPIEPLQVIRWDRVPFTQLIGDGSVVIALLEYAKYKSGTNAEGTAYASGVSFRLGAVQVVEHVPFTEQEHDTKAYNESLLSKFSSVPAPVGSPQNVSDTHVSGSNINQSNNSPPNLVDRMPSVRPQQVIDTSVQEDMYEPEII